MQVRVDDSELRELHALLEQAPAKVGREVSQAVRASGGHMARRAAAVAPKRSGALARSISADFYGSARSGRLVAVVGPTEHHGLFVERGTSKMAAQPFLGPSLDAEAPRLVAALEKLAEGVLS